VSEIGVSEIEQEPQGSDGVCDRTSAESMELSCSGLPPTHGTGLSARAPHGCSGVHEAEDERTHSHAMTLRAEATIAEENSVGRSLVAGS
jgi:hypothetical protein